MYKLMVVAGPNRGSSFPVHDGENSLGRQADNAIVLASARISKRHCVLTVRDGEVTVEDLGSSNGTFINGVLAKSGKLKKGDRITVGEYTFELDDPSARAPRAAPPVKFGGTGIQRNPFGGLPAVPPGGMPTGIPGTGVPGGTGSIALGQPQPPKTLKEKALWALDHYVMPFFYGLNLKHEWTVLMTGLLGVFVVANLFISLQPVFDSGRTAIVREVKLRARFMARQIVERNAGVLAEGRESKTEISETIERGEGVLQAILVDLDGRIIAPPSHSGQYLTTGNVARYALKVRDAIRKGKVESYVGEVDSSTVVAVEPLLVLNPQVARNTPRAIAVVAVDTSLSVPNIGEIGMAYSETLILTGLLGGIVLLIMVRLTLRPFQVLNDEMDRALKGEMPQVTHEFKLKELDSLWDLINSAIQRIPKGGATGAIATETGPAIEEYIPPIQTLGEGTKMALVLFDAERKVVYMNSIFEEISGIRADNARGQTLGAVAREQSLGMLVDDLMEKALGGQVSPEDYDFSGITYKVTASAFVSGIGTVRAFVLMATRMEG